MCESLTADDISNSYKAKKTTHTEKTEKLEGAYYGFHTVLLEEQVAFADWINKNLGDDADLAHLLDLNETGSDMYKAMDDGILMCKIINLAAPETIDERVINKGKNLNVFKVCFDNVNIFLTIHFDTFQQHENLTLAINSASAVGCVVIGIDTYNINSSSGKKYLVLGLLWQLIKMYLFKQISVNLVPGLVNLLFPGEDPSILQRLTPEELLMRWVNHQLEKAGSDRRMTNFNKDIKDSVIYTELIKQIAPEGSGVNKNALGVNDLKDRAEMMLEQADKIDCRDFVTAKDVVNGYERLNVAFVANLFNNHPALDPPAEDIELDIEETREEKMYRNWMNSLGVKPRVNHLYSDLYDGLVIFQVGIPHFLNLLKEYFFSVDGFYQTWYC